MPFLVFFFGLKVAVLMLSTCMIVFICRILWTSLYITFYLFTFIYCSICCLLQSGLCFFHATEMLLLRLPGTSQWSTFQAFPYWPLLHGMVLVNLLEIHYSLYLLTLQNSCSLHPFLIIHLLSFYGILVLPFSAFSYLSCWYYQNYVFVPLSHSFYFNW